MRGWTTGLGDPGVGQVGSMLVMDRAGRLDLASEDVLTATEMYVRRAAAAAASADAARALQAAMGDHRGTVLGWVGCTRERFESALGSRPNP